MIGLHPFSYTFIYEIISESNPFLFYFFAYICINYIMLWTWKLAQFLLILHHIATFGINDNRFKPFKKWHNMTYILILSWIAIPKLSLGNALIIYEKKYLCWYFPKNYIIIIDLKYDFICLGNN